MSYPQNVVTFETNNEMIEASVARNIPLSTVVKAIGMCSKSDTHFEPRRNRTTERWHITDTSSNYVFELVVTGQRWFDLRDAKGGGGAIDLVMHLKSCGFKTALELLAPMIETKKTPHTRG